MGLTSRREEIGTELSEMLPAPAVPPLAPDRQRLLKEHLMSEIMATGIEKSEAEKVGAERVGNGPVRRPPRMRRLVLAGTAAVAIAAVIALQPWNRGDAKVEAAPGVVALLDQAAAAASSMPVPKPGQYIYLETYGHSEQFNGDTSVTILPNQHRQDWTAADGAKEGEYVIDGGTPMPLDPAPYGELYAPSYKYLATLPTDPSKLFGLIKANAHSDLPADEEEFSLVTGIADEVILPPDLAGALYQATKRISGVYVVGATIDALGRPAVGLAQVQKQDGIEMELLFDPTTYVYSGAKEIATRTVYGMTAGQVLLDTAVEQAGVVDQPGDVPRTTV